MRGGCGGAKPTHHKSESIACSSEIAKGGGLKEGLVTVEQIIGGAEDEKRAELARNGEEGVHHIRRSVPRTFTRSPSWKGELQHHGCVAQREDEHVAVREL